MKTVQGIADDVANYGRHDLWRHNRDVRRRRSMLLAFFACALSGGLVILALEWVLR